MRRKRSTTIEANSYEEFMQLSCVNDNDPIRSPELSDPSQSTPFYPESQPEPESQSSNPNKQANKPQIQRSQSYWDDVELQVSTSPDGRSFCEDDSTFCSMRSRSEDDKRLALMGGKLEAVTMKYRKVMVIGGKQTGRHTLIDSLFEKNSKENSKMRSALDLMIKKHQKDEEVNVFKFWIKDADCHDFEQLFRVHYKNIKVFVFIYKTTDRKSFECLQAAIEKARAEVPPEHFSGILIGNIRHQPSFFANLFGLKKRKREVSVEEGEEMSKRYGLTGFVETKLDSTSWKKDVLNFLLPSSHK